MSDERRPYQRSVKNFLLNPRMQIRISLYFVAFGFALTSLMSFVFFTQIQDVLAVLTSSSEIPIEIQVQIGHLLNSLIKITILFFFIFMIGSVLYGLFVSHRIAGPMHAILAYIEDLKNGKFDSARKLRDYDELGPIMDSLHELSDSLENKK